MEIPYIVTPRKDTGLFNSKIAIWLFLASEVMLFGGLFSAYVFLRIGADYPWPERTLPVIPGLINTFVLIASSVTVVFAWASLKLRQWGRFKLFMGITVACAALFMVLKSIEYNVKFHHQAVRLPDYTILEGHLGYEKDEKDEYVLDHNGSKIEENMIRIEASEITYSTVRFHKAWVEEVIAQAEHKGSKIVLKEAIKPGDGKDAVLAPTGEALSVKLLEDIQAAHLDARAHNAELRTEALRDMWKEVKDANPGKRDWQLSNDVTVDAGALDLKPEFGAVTFTIDPPTTLEFKPRDIKEADGQSKLRDDTVINGKLLASPMVFHNVDAIDFQYFAMKAVEKGQDPVAEIEKSWIIHNFPFAKEAWEWHKGKIAEMEKELAKDGREPTFKDRYRIGWKDLRDKSEEGGGAKLGFFKGFIGEEFTGPNYKARGDETFPEFELPREQVAFASKFTPSWNTYYAIYFTITGLHGLHVIGGALVLAYYLLFTRKMYETNPEWLANRVEVAGLFWHFVDLVWIFAFPIFYLM